MSSLLQKRHCLKICFMTLRLISAHVSDSFLHWYSLYYSLKFCINFIFHHFMRRQEPCSSLNYSEARQVPPSRIKQGSVHTRACLGVATWRLVCPSHLLQVLIMVLLALIQWCIVFLHVSKSGKQQINQSSSCPCLSTLFRWSIWPWRKGSDRQLEGIKYPHCSDSKAFLSSVKVCVCVCVWVYMRVQVCVTVNVIVSLWNTLIPHTMHQAWKGKGSKPQTMALFFFFL